MPYLWRRPGEFQKGRVKIMEEIKKEMPATFSSCEKCGYAIGFHLALEKMSEKEVAVKLLCPNCKQAYDLGFRVPHP